MNKSLLSFCYYLSTFPCFLFNYFSLILQKFLLNQKQFTKQKTNVKGRRLVQMNKKKKQRITMINKQKGIITLSSKNTKKKHKNNNNNNLKNKINKILKTQDLIIQEAINKKMLIMLIPKSQVQLVHKINKGTRYQISFKKIRIQKHPNNTNSCH